MSGKVFEYFFEAEDLEPFLSELPRSLVLCRPTLQEPRPEQRPIDESATNLPQEPTAQETFSVPSEEQITALPVEPPIVSQHATLVASPSVEAGEQPEANNANEALAHAPPNRTQVRHLLSVHALGQYVFCPRSAILAAERGDEQDVDEPLPRLTYLPNFDRERIEEELSKKLRHLFFSVAYGLATIGLMAGGLVWQSRAIFYPAFLASFLCFSWFCSLIPPIWKLAGRRRAALKAEATEPPPRIGSVQPINWWSMLKCGFEVVNYDRPFRHPELPLEGCPWRVLERDSFRIPVVRSNGAKLGEGDNSIYSKHMVRLAAYALLLETMGPVAVPYGLVFPADSPMGFAVPITDRLRKKAIELLEEFSVRIRDSQQHQVEPRVPENRNRCENCRHGVPVPISTSEIVDARKSGKSLVVLKAGDRTFHCDCGDRFGTAPPHGKSLRYGLTASLD